MRDLLNSTVRKSGEGWDAMAIAVELHVKISDNVWGM